MPFYEYQCECCGRWDAMRPVAARNDPARCSRGQPAKRVFSVPVIHWPRSLWTQWSDVHSESPRELAARKDIERYNPSGPVAPVKDDTRPAIQRAFKDAVKMHGAGE